MSEPRNNSALQDHAIGVPPPDGASRLLRLSDLAQELGAGLIADEARELCHARGRGPFLRRVCRAVQTRQVYFDQRADRTGSASNRLHPSNRGAYDHSLWGAFARTGAHSGWLLA
jgi:hypothetical protein